MLLLLFSRVRLFAIPWTGACLSFTIFWSLLRLISVEPVMPSNHIILCLTLLLPSIILSIRVFSNESAPSIRWLKYWSFSFNISPSNEHSGLISLGRTVWISLQSKNSQESSPAPSMKASILRHSGFFTDQLSHPYMTTEKTIGLTRRTFVGKVMSLLFNMLSRLVITFLARSKRF